MTTGERLAYLSGLAGVSAAQHLIAIKQSGVNAGQMLVSRSSLATATAMQHLLDAGVALGLSPLNYPIMRRRRHR